MPHRLLFVCVVLTASCGGATPEPAEAPAAEAEPPPEVPPMAHAMASPKIDLEASKPFGAIPTECAEQKEHVCLPPEPFVKRLCKTPSPDVALAMFQKSSPWTRAYLRMNVEAWNASGGPTTSDKLVFDEEVLVLHRRTAAGGAVQVSGSSGGYDVLRWDGTCASLSEEELTLKTPPNKAKFAKIPYRRLDEGIRSALEANEKVGKAADDRRRECKGASPSDPSPSCQKAEDTMSGAIVDYVRGGGSLPAPSRLP